MQALCDFTLKDLEEHLIQAGHKRFVARQIFDWVYQKGVIDWVGMSNLSKLLREQLKETLPFPVLTLQRVQPSDDLETYKFLWKLHDGGLVESVLICSGERRTLCVSSQVGCPARCAFCASGQQGFRRNLSTAEIVEQLLHINRWLADKQECISHVVYMGMGEPFENYENVVRSIRQICSPDGAGISQRRITLSTVGVIEGIQRFTTENDLRVNLVLSLHAPNQHIRKKIIPYARRYALEDIMDAMEAYQQSSKRDITYEYTLIAGINDQPEHAQELVKLLRRRQCTLNLIPYNPIPNVRLSRPSHEAIQAFRKILDDAHIINTCRYTKGDDIAAACGQLALQEITRPENQPPRGLPILNSDCSSSSCPVDEPNGTACT